jgi:hypothetical protein
MLQIERWCYKVCAQVWPAVHQILRPPGTYHLQDIRVLSTLWKMFRGMYVGKEEQVKSKYAPTFR